MARAKFKIDSGKTFRIIRYFIDGIDKSRCLKHLEGQVQAQKELRLLFDRYLQTATRDKAKDTTEITEELKIWLEKYASDKDWTNCLGAIRQRSFCSLKKMKTIKFPAEAYYAIYYYANDRDLPMWEAVFQLVEKQESLLRQARD